MNKFRKLFLLVLAMLACVVFFCACTNEGNATGHTFGEWEIIDDASYYKSGEKTRSCLDSGCSERQTQAIPMTTATTDDFSQVRNSLMGESQFEYNYNINISTKISSINGPAASIVGNVKYNSATENKYLKTETNSGTLVPDGKIYTFLKGLNLETFKVDSNENLFAYDQKAVPSSFKYENSSYAKLLFTDVNLTSLTKNSDLKYKVTLPTTAGIVSAALTALDSPTLAQFVTLPDSSATVDMYITFNGQNGKIEKYEYDFTVSVSLLTVTFHYDLVFTKIGSGVTIALPSFDGYDLTETEINSTLETIRAEINEYKSGNQNGVSGHRYDVKTSVDYSLLQNSVDSRSQGRTLRKIDNSNVYFWNRLEFDSDYKNSDQYGNLITDYERYRANLIGGDVFDVTDGLLSNKYDKVTPYDNFDIDSYYFLLQNSFLTSSNVSSIKTTTTSTKTVFSLGLTSEGIISLLEFIDQSIRMDVDLTDEKSIFNFIENSLALESLKFNIEITDGKLTKIEIVLKGSYVDSIAKDDNNANKTPSFTLDYTITPYYDVNDYTIPVNSNDIDLSNS